MSGFNKSGVAVAKARLTSPIAAATLVPDTITGNGAQAWTRDAKGELFLLAVTNMVGEQTFYEGANERDQRFRMLVRQVTQQDPGWVARFIPWLRGEANMRTASIVAAVEYAQAYKGETGPASELAERTVRKVVDSALQRADEPGEALAYAQTMGYSIPKGLKRGIADAVQRLYTERSLLKYDTDSHGFRFGDVLELTHAKPRRRAILANGEESSGELTWQGDLFAYAISRRHKRDNLAIPESLAMLRARAELEALSVEERRRLVVVASAGVPDESDLAKQRLAAAGVTWESLSGWLQGPMDKDAWEAMIPNMGYMALLRNLRNFDQAGVSDAVAKAVADKLSTPLEVAKSRQLPMRFLSAYNAAPNLRWSWPLEQALNMSLENVPALKGRTLILVDTSSSMNESFSRDGSLKRWDAATTFGLALAMRAEYPEVVSFAGDTRVFKVDKAGSLLKQLEAFRQGYFLGGGTATVPTLQRHFKDHDRVVILTDEQADGYSHAFGGGWGNRSTVTVNDAIPRSVPMYNFNLAGYAAGSTPAGKENRHAFGGLTDTGFKMLALLESRKSATWPF